MKFAFREENVGAINWRNRYSIVKEYFKHEREPFVKEGDRYTVSDFELMIDSNNRRGA